jgi:hypothetical protein
MASDILTHQHWQDALDCARGEDFDERRGGAEVLRRHDMAQREQILLLRQALVLIAGCETVAAGDVVSVARAALAATEPKEAK